MPRQYGTDPYGILSHGAPGPRADVGSIGMGVGRVGLPIQSAAVPGQSMGTGFGGQLNIPLGRAPRGDNVRQKAKGGKVKKMAKGGSTASKRADGCATKGKTKGRFV